MKRRKFSSFREALQAVTNSRDRHLLRNFNFMNDGQPPSVKALAESLGFIVELRSLPNSVSGFLTSDPFAENGWKIVVNQWHSVTRRRFTVLHEIAHYYLHPRFTDLLAADAYRATFDSSDHFYATGDELVEEREANEWVEAVVFEQGALQASLSLHGNNLREVARTFGVSLRTLEIVLKKKGLKP